MVHTYSINTTKNTSTIDKFNTNCHVIIASLNFGIFQIFFVKNNSQNLHTNTSGNIDSTHVTIHKTQSRLHHCNCFNRNHLNGLSMIGKHPSIDRCVFTTITLFTLMKAVLDILFTKLKYFFSSQMPICIKFIVVIHSSSCHFDLERCR